MAALVGGHPYGLSSLLSTSADKTVVHVKLTDSALRTFEEFQKIKDATRRRPIIQFHKGQGSIKVPIKKSSDNPEGYRPFQFTLSATDPKSSFDCVKHSAHSNHGWQLDLLGSMSHKVSIHAQDDVYRTTKEKMTLADEESKKACAKEIKPSGPYIGRKIKKVVKHSSLKSSPTPVSSSSSHHGHGVSQPSNKASISSSRPVSSSTSHSASSRPLHDSSPQQTAPAKPTSSHHHSHSSSGHRSSPTSSGHRSSPNPAVVSMPYRDRIIHLLALRPYKKPELLARLQRDGIKEKDKNSLGQTLQQVAVFNPRDNAYMLQKHLYSEVKEDWPSYTDVDRQLLKRRRPQESSQAATPSPAQSPCHSNSSHGSPTQKRPSSTSDEPHPSKKQRIAHTKKEKEESPADTKVLEVKQPLEVKPPHPPNSLPTSLTVKREATTTTPDSSQHSPTGQKENQSSNHPAKSDASSTSETPEYILKYTPISTAEQRQKYKQDFNAEYDIYRTLHKNVEKVTKRFQDLETSLKKQEQGTEEFENIKNKILTEYKMYKRDPKFVEQKKRCDFLHKKLGHIKKLIVEFDHTHYGDS